LEAPELDDENDIEVGGVDAEVSVSPVDDGLKLLGRDPVFLQSLKPIEEGGGSAVGSLRRFIVLVFIYS
jgi:hypothetical protein